MKYSIRTTVSTIFMLVATVSTQASPSQIDLNGDGVMETVQPSGGGGTDIIMSNSEGIPFTAFHASGDILDTGKRNGKGYEYIQADGRIWIYANPSYTPVIKAFEPVGGVDEATMRKINVLLGNEPDFALTAIASNQRVRLMNGYEAALLWSSAYTMSDGNMIWAVILKDGEPVSALLINVNAHGWYADDLPSFGTSPDLSRIEYINKDYSRIEAYDVKSGERLPDPYMSQPDITDVE